MNEEQAVLDFFSQEENLPLALAVTDLVDRTRLSLNNRFWQDLQGRVDSLLGSSQLSWTSQLTEDRNADDSLVGLHLLPEREEQLFLRPFMEQQLLGDTHRIYCGLMWSAPAGDKAQLAPLLHLQQSLTHAGFKQNESFLAWRWTALHPRRRDFLLRYTTQPAALLDEAMAIWQSLLVDHGPLLDTANRVLADAASTQSISLTQLRSTLKR